MRLNATTAPCAGLALVLLAGAIVGPALPVAANPDKLAYGKHLSQECTTCHRRDGADKGIPSIVGLEPEYFANTLKFYKTGARANPVMNSVAQALSDEQVEALAAYFATLKPAAKADPGARRR